MSTLNIMMGVSINNSHREDQSLVPQPPKLPLRRLKFTYYCCTSWLWASSLLFSHISPNLWFRCPVQDRRSYIKHACFTVNRRTHLSWVDSCGHCFWWGHHCSSIQSRLVLQCGCLYACLCAFSCDGVCMSSMLHVSCAWVWFFDVRECGRRFFQVL